MNLSVIAFSCACLFVGGQEGEGDSVQKAPKHFEKLAYRSVGPASGGRVSRACGVAGDPLTYYVATSAGGVWKSTDGGLSFKPIFDDQPCSSIGSIAVAPSDSNVVYVGTGEANIRGNVAAGVGIFKSTDAGKTWKHVWNQVGHIGTMAVHPTNPNIAFAAVLGHAFGPNSERGIYRTTDGGSSWSKVHFVNDETGASDVCFDVTNPRTLYAGFWQTRRQPWELTSGGPGSGLYVSRDGGDSWDKIGPDAKPKKKPTKPAKVLDEESLPPGPWGRVGVAVAPSDGSRVYALIEADKGGLFRSDDGGGSWVKVNEDRAIRQRAWYYTTLTVDPKNPDIVWCPQVPLLKSIDGGKSFTPVEGPHHGDHHDLWIDPQNPRRMINSNDGGVDISTDGGKSWHAPALAIAQFYHVACDNRLPYRVMGNMQDQGTASGPSNSLRYMGIPLADWYGVGGGETGYSMPHPTEPDVVFSGEYAGIITRYDHRTKQARNISIYPYNASGHGAEDLRIRFQWTAPIVISHHDPKVVYHAGNHLFRTTNNGQNWEQVSPDLTRNDRSKMKWSGGPITGDNTTAEFYGTIFALAESPKQKGLLWAGTDDGLVHLSRDDGKTWTNLTKNIPDLPDWGTVSCLEASPHDAGTAWLVVDAHRLDNYRPYLWKTTNFGATWERLGEELDGSTYLHVVREDPVQKNLLFVGSERGVQFSSDGGDSFEPLRLNMPTVAVHDLQVHQGDLVVGTNGRSIWILDDLNPVRTWKEEHGEKTAHLFPIRPAVSWHLSGTVSHGQEIGLGENPATGALIQYHLKAKPKVAPTLEILDSVGKRVAFLDGSKHKKKKPGNSPDDQFPEIQHPEIPAEEGINRFYWDLSHSPARIIPKALADMGNPASGVPVSPGTYKAVLTVDGQKSEGTFEVWADPRLVFPGQTLLVNKIDGKTPPALLAELKEQEQFALSVRESISNLSDTVVRLRKLHRQVDLQIDLQKEEANSKEWLTLAKELSGKLEALEKKLHNPTAKVSYDILAMRGGAKLYSQLVWLYGQATDGDGAPTQGMRELMVELGKEQALLLAEFNQLIAQELAKVNALGKKLELPVIWLPK
jgi:photosystem II stability/assembly factor-like uncharacterized protein